MSSFAGQRSRVVRNRRERERYGARHRLTRRMLAPLVDAGLARCVRCRELIEPGSPWDLGHDDRNPRVHSGPEHADCNRGAPHRNKVSREW